MIRTCINIMLLVSILGAVVQMGYTQEVNIQDYLDPPPKTKADPVPYRQEEFPYWMYLTYRFLAVTVGSVPFSMLVSTVIYDTYRTIDASTNTSTFQSKYLPLFFSGPDKPPYLEKDVIGIIWTTLGVSLGVGLTDLIITLVLRNRNKSFTDLFTEAIQ